jgi:endonuclease/exonuclease/phosphatase (EEP) superfamily protein YafD
VRKFLAYFIFFFWLLLLFMEAWIWGNVQDLFIPDHPIMQIIASILQDTLWIPLGLALPVYLYFSFHRMAQRLLVRLPALAAAAGVTVWAFCDLAGYFKFLLIFILLFFVLLVKRTLHKPVVSANVLIFSIALAGLVLHYQQQLLPSWNSDPGAAITLLDYNIRVNQNKAEREQVLTLIDRLRPDLVFIQEISGTDRTLFNERFRAVYPHQLWADRRETYNGGAILSRFPFEYSTNIDIRTEYSSGHINLNHVVIRLDGKEVHLLNAHLFPSGHAFIELLAGQRSLASFIHDTRSTYLRRNQEAERMAKRVMQISGRVIVAGDFNDTPHSRTYELFNETLQNAFREKGWGLGATFGFYSLKKSMSPFWSRFAIDFLRIDHVFVSSGIKVVSAQVLPYAISDHRPQLVRLRIE